MKLSVEQRARVLDHIQERMASCVPWSPNTRWAPELNIVGSSYPSLNLFPELRVSSGSPGGLGPGAFVDSSSGKFRYLVRHHPVGKRLETWWGHDIGDVLFDAGIQIPMLFERAGQQRDGSPGVWPPHPWMSITPAEMITLRPGTRLARGKVVIGGLGLAYQLLAVAKQRLVREIVLVERSHELCDLILPRVLPAIRKKITVLIGDVFQVLPTLSADVALLDTFPTYGDNRSATDALAKKCPRIKKMWGWGAYDGDPMGTQPAGRRPRR
ncbi:MAG: hypothetical protein V3V08_10755 [Nannocystaceae bacterium]